jgi:hypothetical protein
MSTTVTQTDDPTLAYYQCQGCGPTSFKWGKHTPNGGRLGEVTHGSFVNKPIQVFDAQPIAGGSGGTDWAFQAQDGSFLGRMYVSPHKSYIRFAKFRPGDPWPQMTCVSPQPDPADPRDPIDKRV